MVINMNDTRLCTIEQIEQFLGASAQIDFSAHGGDLERFGYHQRGKRERGVLLRYLQHTSGYSRAQVNRLVGRIAPEITKYEEVHSGVEC